jgi:hypothetical protein
MAEFGREFQLRGSKCQTNPISPLLQHFNRIFGREQSINGGLMTGYGALWRRIPV